MQERYLGDVHDYAKFALLSHLSKKLEVRLGVNWYRTHSSKVDSLGNRDGGNRRFLDNMDWCMWNPTLSHKLQCFKNEANRTLPNFHASGALPPDTLFFDEELHPGAVRDDWHTKALEKLSGASLIFLDPDNGFEVPSCTRKRMPKYARYAEAKDHFSGGKIVVGIQFVSKRDPIQRGREVREALTEVTGAARIPILRVRVSPNILFLALCHEEKGGDVCEALSSFVLDARQLRLKSGEKRVELID
jgi:hypothetical protein